MKLSNIIDLVDSGDIALPEFQRGYVWNRDQVRSLMQSLYRGYPVGSLLTWHTKLDPDHMRGAGSSADGYVKLLLDGQQRVTSLYGIMRGRPPGFFDGNAATFTGLYFHIDDEVFEFYSPSKMDGDPRWIDVTALMQQGLGPFLPALASMDGLTVDQTTTYVNRLNAITQIAAVDFHVDEVTGEDKTIDVVVDIFNRVNSGGTKLSKGDLALARICAAWPEARDEMKDALAGWQQAGFTFKLDWLLRVTNGVATGEALFSALAGVPVAQFRDSLRESVGLVGTLLDSVAARLGLDHDRVLAGRYAFPVMARYLHQQGGRFPSQRDKDRLLYWYVHAFLWGRFVGSSETVLNQDLKAMDAGGVDGLIEQLERSRGGLTVRASDFLGYGVGARFYPLLYLLTRVHEARDFCTNQPLKAYLLGRNSSLEMHHIFPKAQLYRHGYPRAQVNAVANFCFLTKGCNITISAADPAAYFRQVEDRCPGALASQWIPMDESLWSLDRYPEFLAARRELLAAAANRFLDGLRTGALETAALQGSRTVQVDVETDAALAEVDALISWLRGEGFALPDRDLEIVDPQTKETIAVAEAAWMDGLQEGLGEPVVLDLELDEDVDARLAALGIRAFPTPASLREFVERRPTARIDLLTLSSR